MEIGTTEGFTEIIDRPTEAICDRSALPDGTALENGRYEIRMTLGNGGFGITYKAWDYRLQRFVAIKEFFPDALRTGTPGKAGRCGAFRMRRPSSMESTASRRKRSCWQSWIFPTLSECTTALRKIIPSTS